MDRTSKNLIVREVHHQAAIHPNKAPSRRDVRTLAHKAWIRRHDVTPKISLYYVIPLRVLLGVHLDPYTTRWAVEKVA